MTEWLSFHLSDDFVAQYKDIKPNFGYKIGHSEDSLGELTYVAKYSRLKEDGTKERWFETTRRCIEGMYSILKDHCIANRTSWNENKAQASAKDAYDRMFYFKWTPPGRGLANMGTAFVHAEKNSASLYNCAALSTEKLANNSVYEATYPFTRLMEMSMNGIGVGYDVRGAGKLTIHQPTDEVEVFVVPDSREGWSESLRKLLESYFFKNRAQISFDYSLVRPQGAPLKRFGGTASGPEPLKKMHDSIARQLANRNGDKVTSRDIVDIMNKIGKAVTAGGSRRSATLSLGDSEDSDYVNLKNWNLPENAERTGPDGWSWMSNNSVYADAHTDLSALADQISINGEPGVIYPYLMQTYGRVKDGINKSDYRANLTNPCAEIQLEGGGELCNLSELYPVNHDSFADLCRSIKHAYMYSKAITLTSTLWPETNEIVTRNRRIGVSMTGVVEFIETRSYHEIQRWMDEGYNHLRELDKTYSAWLGVRESIRVSTVKPAGSTSLLAGTTAGVHWPTATGWFLRRLRFLKSDVILLQLKKAGYHIEPDQGDPDSTVVVEMPIKGLDIRNERDVSLWEKALLAAMAQEYWSDNLVSCTVSFDQKREANQIAPLLRGLQGRLKSISFLPLDSEGSIYPQAPYETIDGAVGERISRNLKSLNWDAIYRSGKEAEGERFCTTDKCELNL